VGGTGLVEIESGGITLFREVDLVIAAGPDLFAWRKILGMSLNFFYYVGDGSDARAGT